MRCSSGYAEDPRHQEAGAPPPQERRDEPREPLGEARDASTAHNRAPPWRMEAGAADTERLVRETSYAAWTARYCAAVGNEHYRSAFWRVMADPQFGHLQLSAQETDALRAVSALVAEREMREMSIGVTSTGGFAVPANSIRESCRRRRGHYPPVRQIAESESITTNQWRGVSSDGVTASYSQEAAAMIDGSPVLGQPIVTAERWTTFQPFSWELAQDWTTLRPSCCGSQPTPANALESSMFWTGPRHCLSSSRRVSRTGSRPRAAHCVTQPPQPARP